MTSIVNSFLLSKNPSSREDIKGLFRLAYIPQYRNPTNLTKVPDAYTDGDKKSQYRGITTNSQSVEQTYTRVDFDGSAKDSDTRPSLFVPTFIDNERNLGAVLRIRKTTSNSDYQSLIPVFTSFAFYVGSDITEEAKKAQIIIRDTLKDRKRTKFDPSQLQQQYVITDEDKKRLINDCAITVTNNIKSFVNNSNIERVQILIAPSDANIANNFGNLLQRYINAAYPKYKNPWALTRIRRADDRDKKNGLRYDRSDDSAMRRLKVPIISPFSIIRNRKGPLTKEMIYLFNMVEKERKNLTPADYELLHSTMRVCCSATVKDYQDEVKKYLHDFMRKYAIDAQDFIQLIEKMISRVNEIVDELQNINTELNNIKNDNLTSLVAIVVKEVDGLIATIKSKFNRHQFVDMINKIHNSSTSNADSDIENKLPYNLYQRKIWQSHFDRLLDKFYDDFTDKMYDDVDDINNDGVNYTKPQKAKFDKNTLYIIVDDDVRTNSTIAKFYSECVLSNQIHLDPTNYTIAVAMYANRAHNATRSISGAIGSFGKASSTSSLFIPNEQAKYNLFSGEHITENMNQMFPKLTSML